jgi:hypothetical protein
VIRLSRDVPPFLLDLTQKMEQKFNELQNSMFVFNPTNGFAVTGECGISWVTDKGTTDVDARSQNALVMVARNAIVTT